MGPNVRYELAGAVATLTLDRPQRLNAIAPALRGAGRAFWAGCDIGWGAEEMAAEEGEDVRAAVAGCDTPFGDYGQAA